MATIEGTNGDLEFGPPDAHGRRRSLDGSAMSWPGEQLTHFTKDGVGWVRLADNREFEEAKFWAGTLDGSIESGIHPLNCLI